MTGIILRHVATLLQAVDLRVILGEEDVVLFLALLHVDVSIVGAGDQDGRRAMVTGVVADLELAKIIVDLALDADGGLGDELLAVPVPEEDLPVWLAGQRDNEAIVFVIEGARHELSRLVRVQVLNVLRHRLLFPSIGQVIDAELAFVADSAALAHGKPMLLFVDRDVSDCLSVGRSCKFRKFGQKQFQNRARADRARARIEISTYLP